MIKKILGIVLLLLGVLIENVGMVGMARSRVKLQLQAPERIEQYTHEHDKALMIGGSLFTIGMILLIIGIVLVASKTKAQKEKEMELYILKSKKHE